MRRRTVLLRALRTMVLTLVPGLACLASGPLAAAPVLRLVANLWEPYTGDNLPEQGVASRIVTTALKRAGYASVIEIMPWARALATVNAGKADGIVAIWPTATRRGKLLFSESYMANELILLQMSDRVVRRGAGRPTLAQLQGLTVGVGNGYEYSDEFLAQNNFRKEPVTSVLQNLRKLAMGRVDLVLEDRRVAEFSIRAHVAAEPQLQKILLDGPVVMQLPLQFALHPATPGAENILAAFNAELRKMGRDGTLAALLARPPSLHQ